MLDKIKSTDDIKKLDKKDKKILAGELRKYILEVVSKNGGHLGSNLGVVELTIAMHSIFNFPEDKVVWDVGHQSYVHKILTGRKEGMNTLRKLNGIAGFPKPEESIYDSFVTGHSSTSISVALGMARSRDLKKKKNNIIAVIGDGALTGGMALEALNDVGYSKTNMIVILNDNEMSISKNIGGMSMFLSKLRTKKFNTRSNNVVKRYVEKIPHVGDRIITAISKIKRSIKQLFIPKMFFEDIGFTYIGPVDGHDIEKLEGALKICKSLEKPVLMHVITRKGKGYKYAENNPNKYHSIAPFDIKTGKLKKAKKVDYSYIFGRKLVKLAKENEKIVAITASMKDGTGIEKFSHKYKDRFFDVGIAEQHAIAMAAGMAKEGFIPFVPIYSSFYQRAYDQVIHDVCIQKLHVIMCIDRAGIVGEDGETHQGIYDLSFFRLVPNITIMAPKDFYELEQMLEFAVKLNKPIAIRYPKGGQGKEEFKVHDKIQEGKAETIYEGEDITIIAIGNMVYKAKCVADKLKEDGISSTLINTRFLKPLDEALLLKAILKTKKVVTIEDNTLVGGLATSIKELIVNNNVNDVKIESFGYPDVFVKHGTVEELEKIYGLDIENIILKIKENLI